MDFASYTRQGEKEFNTDYIATFEDGETACFAVADGRVGEHAAELAVTTVAEAFKACEAITKNSVSDFFSAAHKNLKTEEFLYHACMAFMLTDGSVAVWGNIGDCRVYLLRDKLLYEITPDHSGAYALYESGLIRYPKIRTNSKRYDLTQMLGKGYDGEPNVYQPEIIKKDDAFLICTDGFWENIHERQIEKTLRKSKSAQEWLDKMLKIIDKNIKLKKYTKYKDSLSAVTIKF